VDRWIDPNGSNPKSYGYERKPSEPELNQTGSGAYKTPNLPVQSISYVHFSLFSYPSERNSHLSLLSSSSSTAGFWNETAGDDEDSSESSLSPP
jgi:hypothetical protein